MSDDEREAVATLDGDATAMDADATAMDPDVPSDLRRAFWTIVALANVSLFAVSLGVMLLVFRGQVAAGGASLVVGVAALALAVRRYRRRNA